jgi:hypothetical protein
VSVQETISHKTKPPLAEVSWRTSNGRVARKLQWRLLRDGISSAGMTQNLAAIRSYSVLPLRAIYTTPSWQHDHSHADGDRKCWNCGRATDALKELFFCECGVVQSPATKVTYFTLFNIDETFDVELKELSDMYKFLQKNLHPDKYSQKSEVG